MRIKKKEAVVPFRETVAYRTLIVGGSVIVFITALYILVGALYYQYDNRNRFRGSRSRSRIRNLLQPRPIA